MVSLLDPSLWPRWVDALVAIGLLVIAWILWWPFWRTYRRKGAYGDFLFGKIEPDSILYPFAKFEFTFENGCALVLFALLALVILAVWIFS